MALRRFCVKFRTHLKFYSTVTKVGLPQIVAAAIKPKSCRIYAAGNFSDAKVVRAIGGKGGNGCISFLKLWCNERAGPDGGDGGNGGHVVFEASRDVGCLNHLSSTIQGKDGQDGSQKECHGRCASHTIIKVPVGTIIRNRSGVVVGDLNRERMLFVAARGGAGGKGNRFFTTEKSSAPKVSEHGPPGEDILYTLEMCSMADVGIIGFPNAGKSTLLNAIARTRSKVAPYAFTTINPQIGMVQYADYFQLSVADLPGIIPGSHRNKGLGLQFLKHVERCAALIFLLDASSDSPWLHFEALMNEILNFNEQLTRLSRIIVANKIDKPGAKKNLLQLRAKLSTSVIGISAKDGTNVKKLLEAIRIMKTIKHK